LSHCSTEHNQRCGVALLGRITTVAISKSGQMGRQCTVAACPHVLQAMMTQVSSASVTCEHALETREPSRIGRPANHFFILEVCGPQRVTEHVAVPGPSRAGRQDPTLYGMWQYAFLIMDLSLYVGDIWSAGYRHPPCCTCHLHIMRQAYTFHHMKHVVG
jgi:hypothetical protein